MADTDVYATLHMIDPQRIKCATVGCNNQANDHKIQTIIGQFVEKVEGQNEPTIHVELYFCHNCYRAVKTILNGNYSPWAISGMEYKQAEEVQ